MTEWTPELRELSLQEWEKWREICALLVEAGAVTEIDCRTPYEFVGPKTLGTRIFHALREWGQVCRLLTTEEGI